MSKPIFDDELLIENVRKHKELYDSSKKNYHDYAFRDLIWRRIAREMNTTVKACKTRWITLRDQLRKVLRKKTEIPDHNARELKKWKYEDTMSFIIPFFSVRKKRRKEPIPYSTDEELSEDDNTADRKYEDTESGDDTKTDIFSKKSREETSIDLPSNLSSHSLSIKKHRRTQRELPASLMRYIQQKTGSSNAASNAMQIELFFDGIAATVKNFSPVYQRLAKKRIFALISELEVQQLYNS